MNKYDKLVERKRKFNSDRDWDQFHSPANLAKSVAIESGELLECFQWDNDHFDKDAVCDEMADVFVYLIDMADRLGVDLVEIADRKMDKNEKKYPVEKAKGNSTKYNNLKKRHADYEKEDNTDIHTNCSTGSGKYRISFLQLRS